VKRRSITQNAEEYAAEEAQNLKCGMIQTSNVQEADMSWSGWLSVIGGLTSTAILIYGSIKSGIYWILIGLVFIVWGVGYNVRTELRGNRKEQESPGGTSEQQTAETKVI